MADEIGPNNPNELWLAGKAQQLRYELWTRAERSAGVMLSTEQVRRSDARRAVRPVKLPDVHASSRRPSVSRVPEIGTHGLKGGPALSPVTFNG